MDTNRMLAELRAERDRIERAIAAIEGLGSSKRGSTARSAKSKPVRGRRGSMSPAARRKLSRLLKQRWAQGKMKPKGKVA